MRFALSSEQDDIRRTARDALAGGALERVRRAAATGRHDDDLWRTIRELGWTGTAVAEDHGGSGLGLVELVLLMEEIGRVAAPVPLLGSVRAALLIDAAGSDAQRERWLPALATGTAVGAVGAAGELSADADIADLIVLVDDDEAWVVERADAAVEPVATIDATRGYARAAGPGEPLTGDISPALDRASLVFCAELCGLGRRALEMAVDHARERRQFGRPIGAFQAVAHRCAEMLMQVSVAETLTRRAAWTADSAPADLVEHAALARAAAAAIRGVTAAAIQVHGGIGYTWEGDVHWFYKRAQLDAQLLGGTRDHANAARLAARRLAATTEMIG